MQPRQPNRPNPRPDVAAILLGGPGQPPLDGGQHHGFGGGFLELFDDAGTAHLWQTHETYLRGEAARLGIQPEWGTDDGRLLFYAEYVQHTLQTEGKGLDE